MADDGMFRSVHKGKLLWTSCTGRHGCTSGFHCQTLPAMKRYFLFIGLFLVSCNPYMDLKKGVVHAGFMSSTQAFSGKVKMADGTTATWSVVGTDGTSVPNNAINVIGTGVAAHYAFKTVDSNNVANTTQAKNASDAVTAQKQIDADAASKAAETARKQAADPILIPLTKK